MILNSNPLGLKLWSVNTDYYYEEAQKLYAQKYFDYIELYVVPDTLKYLPKWVELAKKIPINIHAPHYMHGFNLADKDKREHNLNIYQQVKTYADALNSEYIIFHLGIEGSIEESVLQLSSFSEKRAIIENKPYKPAFEPLMHLSCRGAVETELEYVLSRVECGFCLDFCHAICTANSLGLEPYTYVAELNKLQPCIYHLVDSDIISEIDQHRHFGQGSFNISKLLINVLANAKITIETKKNSKEKLDDFVEDICFINNIITTDIIGS